MVSLGIFMLVISSVFSLFFGGQKFSLDGATAEVATEYGIEGIDAVRSIADRGWADLATGTHGLVFASGDWYFASTAANDTKGIYTRSVTVTEIDDNTRKASTTIQWTSDLARPQTVEVAEILTNWKYPLSGGCVSYPLSGNWAAPQLLGEVDIGAGISGSDVAINYPYAFVSGKSSTSNKHDIFSFDVSNPASPTLLNSLDIGSGGIEDLHLQGKYLYAASPNDSRELIIFDVSNPSAMVKVGEYDLTGTSNALAVFTFPNASTTAIGRTDSAVNELEFFNISNPASPSSIFATTTGGDIEDFYVNNDTLYLVSQQSDPDIWWFDISGAIPVLNDTYDITGTTEDVSIWLQNKDGLANLFVGNENNDEIRIIGTYSSTTGGFYVRDIYSVGGDVLDIICAEGDLGFLATGNANKEFVIVDASNPDNMTEYASLNLSNVATGIDYADNRVYVAVRSNDALKIIGPGP